MNAPSEYAKQLRQQLLANQVQDDVLPEIHPEGSPIKRLKTKEDMVAFEQSSAYASLKQFILILNESIKQKTNKECMQCLEQESNNTLVKQILHLLQHTLIEWLQEFPPVQEKSLNRYGNVSFRKWHEKMWTQTHTLLYTILTDCHITLEEWQLLELSAYFKESFGNRTRIDYGTGHEAAFLAFLFCLHKMCHIAPMYLVGCIFVQYLETMRQIQLYYRLEPAGSHGVWGLDDYQALPFLFGSSQLIDHPIIKPKSIHNKEIVDCYSQDYLYLRCIQFIMQVKKGPFAEHSPMLNDISAVNQWSKINMGMFKMYEAEVLKKHVVIQHFLFGKTLSF